MAPVTLPTGADEAGEPPDNLLAVLIGALVVAFVAHLLSTTVGGMDPVE